MLQKNRIKSEIVNHRTKRLRFQHRDLMIRSTLLSNHNNRSRDSWITTSLNHTDSPESGPYINENRIKKKHSPDLALEILMSTRTITRRRDVRDLLCWSWPASWFFYNTGSSSHALCIISAYKLATPQPSYQAVFSTWMKRLFWISPA